ncbi:major capsid protein [Xanthobacter aminoxidans]|uniref:hypothetical protein n=1 Tax=Xanthobacter aminoxidans TaxID=186280 RepID=UPI002022EDC6|nr:hypothetical protein [Xanthobacter aminoxidans]MCL8384155.1 hypothetical protein [Xanthobacter aminoxidans]
MTNTTVSRLGQINGAGDVQALFLKLFSGEVLTEFERINIFKGLHFVRQISNGKSAQFPLIGRATSGYHTPGNWIDGSSIDHAETIITVDDLLQSNVFIANVDEAMNHYDVRGPYSKELGQALAFAYDSNVARVITLAARAASPLTGRPGGSRITDAAMATDPAKLEAALFTAAQTLDEKNVGLTDTQAVFRPAQYYLLAQRDRLVDTTLGARGSVATGRVDTIAGFPIVKSNHVPSTNVTTGPAKYQGDFRTTVGLVFNKMAAGTVQLMDMSMESEYEIRRQGTFFIAKYLVGHGILRPDCAIEVATGAVA